MRYCSCFCDAYASSNQLSVVEILVPVSHLLRLMWHIAHSYAGAKLAFDQLNMGYLELQDYLGSFNLFALFHCPHSSCVANNYLLDIPKFHHLFLLHLMNAKIIEYQLH